MAGIVNGKMVKTSTNIAHDEKIIKTTGYERIKRNLKCPQVLQSLLEDTMLRDDIKSEMKRQYTIKDDESCTPTNPVIPKLNFMKPLVDAKLTFIKRSIIPQRSTSHHDYCNRKQEIPEPEPPLLPAFPLPIKTTPLLIDYTSEAYVKYLDPSATTYKLSYPRYPPSFIENGIGRQDGLTFYNWHLHYKPAKNVFPITDQKVCQEGPSIACKKRPNEFPSQVQHVPNRGLNTEMKSNFIDPKDHPQYMEMQKPVKQYLVNIEPVGQSTTTETEMYGSGERVEKYV